MWLTLSAVYMAEIAMGVHVPHLKYCVYVRVSDWLYTGLTLTTVYMADLAMAVYVASHIMSCDN